MPLKFLWVREETRQKLLQEAERQNQKLNGSFADEVILTGLQHVAEDENKKACFEPQPTKTHSPPKPDN